MTTSIVATTLPTPAGPLAVLVGAGGVVRAAGFAPVADMTVRLEAGSGPVEVRELSAEEAAHDATLADVVRAVAAYSGGDLHALDAVPVEQPGGPFLQEAWAAMRRIEPGAPVTYAGLAAAAGRPAAIRAAGSACARNLIAPFVPCHRVVRTGGALGGYYYGLDAKRALLALEAGGSQQA